MLQPNNVSITPRIRFTPFCLNFLLGRSCCRLIMGGTFGADQLLQKHLEKQCNPIGWCSLRRTRCIKKMDADHLQPEWSEDAFSHAPFNILGGTFHPAVEFRIRSGQTTLSTGNHVLWLLWNYYLGISSLLSMCPGSLKLVFSLHPVISTKGKSAFEGYLDSSRLRVHRAQITTLCR